MRIISIRQFQRYFYRELKDLPFIVTKQNPHTREDKKEFIVLPYVEETPVVLEPPFTEEPIQQTVVVEEEKNSIADKVKRLFKRT